MSERAIKILLIEDEAYDVRRIKNTLKSHAAQLSIEDSVENGQDAVRLLESGRRYDVAILDFQIAGGLFGENLIRKLKSIDPSLQILVITKMTINQSDLKFANALMDAGAYWYGTKYPGDIEEFIYQPTDFILTIMNASALRQAELSRNKLGKRLDTKINTILDESRLVGNSPEMEKLRELIEKYAQPQANVLIVGESGTGKELIARNIHYRSPRKYDPFIAVNCAAIPRELVESELFGYEKGAFTGADRDKQGLFEQADGGTLFLDEITELPKSAQAKLLRVLQEGEIDKLGRKSTYRVNVRILAATNKHNDELLSKQILREDLFYRLNILHIKVPALRERLGDIPFLIEHFYKYYCNSMGFPTQKLDRDVLRPLENYSWPGNIRQLKNVIQRLVILAGSSEINVNLIKLSMSGLISTPGQNESQGDFSFTPSLPMKDMDRKFRKAYIQHILKYSKNDSDAAEQLGMAPSNFYRSCKDLGLK